LHENIQSIRTFSIHTIRRDKAEERKEILSRRTKDRILLSYRKHVQGFIYACIQCNCTNDQNRNMYASSYIIAPRKLMGVLSTMSLERNCKNEGLDNNFIRISTICDVEEYYEVVDDAFESDHEKNIDRAQSALF